MTGNLCWVKGKCFEDESKVKLNFKRYTFGNYPSRGGKLPPRKKRKAYAKALRCEEDPVWGILHCFLLLQSWIGIQLSLE